ncbi:MAG: hypothetical protein LBI79_06105 [Nitrososphaerota archaeon]|jgi:hypothetical protein|nr:hypothetical protein [Nitrososphaerota archaeon]
MSLKELLSLIVAIPTFLFLSSLFPQVYPLFLVLWICCLSFDVYSTYQFYLENPSQFQNNERNKLFVGITEKVGFKKATLLFPLTIEIPLLLFFAALPLQTLHTYISPNAPNQLIACIMASFGISAIGHLQAALTNTKHNRKQPTGATVSPKRHTDCVVMPKLWPPHQHKYHQHKLSNVYTKTI